MYYKAVLEILEIVFGSTSFDTNGVLRVMYDPRVMKSATLAGEYIRSRSPISLKMVSKDLDKLYKMGFLKRMRHKRQVKTASGKTYYKGFSYAFNISKQGHSYVTGYLWNPTPRKRKNYSNSLVDRYVYENLLRKAPSLDEAEVIWARYKSLRPSKNPRPIDLRFPARHDPYLLALLTKVTKERDQLRRELPKIRADLESLKRATPPVWLYKD